MADPPELDPTDLDCVLSAYTAKWFTSDRLPEMAAGLLEGGHDSPSLRLLAGLERDQPTDAKALFLLALTELGRALPDDEAAAVYLSRRIAVSMLNGSRSPLGGARAIDKVDRRAHSGWPYSLQPILYLLEVWDEGRIQGKDFDTEALRLAKELVKT